MSYTPGPLPEPDGAIDLDCGPAPGGGREVLAVDGFTAHQMREYAAAEVARAVAAERERCAMLVDVPKEYEAWEVIGGQDGIYMLRELAAAIRTDPQRLQGKGE